MKAAGLSQEYVVYIAGAAILGWVLVLAHLWYPLNFHVHVLLVSHTTIPYMYMPC